MTAVGFRRAIIQILDKDLSPVPDKKFVVEGKTKEGATSSFEITGLAPEALKIYGSDITYEIFQKGTGELAVKFSALDLPFEMENEVLGRKKSTSGVYHAGEETDPPYCAVLFESATLHGEKMGTGLYAGKFGKDAVSGKSKEGKMDAPDPDEYSFEPIEKEIEGKKEAVGFAVGDSSYEALKTELFGAETKG
ncbi:major tail protein [Enterococcus avium]|uniref:major tail protein n=1 Tax=Enterococcus avium TaxID=33945 RepID=UPI001F58E54E|nr:major tail protein [Enterococcus avium]